jgi:hypothetical protein
VILATHAATPRKNPPMAATPAAITIARVEATPAARSASLLGARFKKIFVRLLLLCGGYAILMGLALLPANHRGKTPMAKNPKNAEAAEAVPTAETTETPQASKAKRAKVAQRDWINADGEVVAEELATGVRYTNIESGESFDWQTGAPAGSAAVMLACFGALTLMGNVANTRINGLDGSGSEAIADIKERFELLETGKWIDRSEGARGPKYDLGKLATAFIEVRAAMGSPVKGTYDEILQKLTEDKSVFAKVRGNPDVQKKYAELTGKAPKSVADIDL